MNLNLIAKTPFDLFEFQAAKEHTRFSTEKDACCYDFCILIVPDG